MKRTIDIPTDALAVAAQQREAEEFATTLADFSIDDATDYAAADALLSDVVRRKDAAVAMRQSATGPLKEVTRTIEGWFRPLVHALEGAERHLKSQIGAYRLAMAGAEREAREAAAVAAETGDGDALVDALTVAADAAAPPPGRSTAAFGWRVARVIDSMVPHEYWIVDRASLDALARAAGHSEEPPIVPGVVFERFARVGARR